MSASAASEVPAAEDTTAFWILNFFRTGYLTPPALGAVLASPYLSWDCLYLPWPGPPDLVGTTMLPVQERNLLGHYESNHSLYLSSTLQQVPCMRELMVSNVSRKHGSYG